MQLTHQDDVLFLKGDATVSSITREDLRLLEQACKQSTHIVALSGLDKVDSTCVALLIAIKRSLGNQAWQLRSVPAAVSALLELYELEWLA